MGLVLISLSKSIRWENKQKANENSFQNKIKVCFLIFSKKFQLALFF